MGEIVGDNEDADIASTATIRVTESLPLGLRGNLLHLAVPLPLTDAPAVNSGAGGKGAAAVGGGGEGEGCKAESRVVNVSLSMLLRALRWEVVEGKVETLFQLGILQKH